MLGLPTQLMAQIAALIDQSPCQRISMRAQSTQVEIERQGRKRPDTFKTTRAEIGFCFSLLASMFMAEYFISGFNIILPTLSTALEIPAESRTWPASVFSLITGAFLLPLGRVADIYGGSIVFTCGLIWFMVWSIIGGFSQDYLMLIFCRALQGLGPAAFLPSGIMLLGKIYRPGPRKNLVFSLYGAFSPIGFFSGIFVGGISDQYLSWSWYFWIGAIILCVVSCATMATVPSDRMNGLSEVKMDWLGVLTIVPGLLLVVFAITDSSHATNGWRTPHISIAFVLGSMFLCAAVYVEGWVAATPLLPFDIFKVKYIKALLLSLFFTYGVFGIYLFYASFYIQYILDINPLQTTAWFAPMAAGGLILATIGGFTLHLMPGKVLLVLSGFGYLFSVLLFAIMPDNASYWAYVFPAMLCATLGVDVTYSVSNVFITTSLPKHRQGLAGALINSVLFLGISFFLGLADLVVSTSTTMGSRKSYKAAFWFGLGCAGFGLVVVLIFVEIGRAKSDLTIEERAELGPKSSAKFTNGALKHGRRYIVPVA